MSKRFFALCIVVMTASLAYMVYYLFGWQQQNSLEQRQQQWLSEIPKVVPAASDAASPERTPDPSAAPSSKAQPDYRERFQTILDKNPDFFGLLSIPGTKIEDKFVVQGQDNSYYLNRDFEGKFNPRGTLFLDSGNRPGFSDNNYVIYGHNMNDGSMLHDIIKYENPEYYLKAPVITFDTVDGPTSWLIFAVYVCEPDWDYYRTSLSDDAFAEVLDEIYMRSYYHTGVEVLPDDCVLTLSTCVYTFQDARFAVQARLLREGESFEDMVFAAEKNTKRKGYNVPNLLKLTDMPAADAAFDYSVLNRPYYFRRTAEGIVWYCGSGADNVQGPYMAWSGSFNDARFSGLSAIAAPDGKREFFIASGGMDGDTPGLFMLRSTSPGGPYKLMNKAPITPEGVDARNPELVIDNEQNIILKYRVRNGDVTELWSISLNGGEPKRTS